MLDKATVIWAAVLLSLPTGIAAAEGAKKPRPDGRPAKAEKEPATEPKKIEVRDEENGAEGKPPKEEVAILIGGKPYLGYLLPPLTETTFRFKLSATKDTITLSWTALDKDERLRVQRLCRMGISESGVKEFGREIRGLKIHLKNGRSVIGLPVKERSVPGYLALRTARMPLLLLPKGRIKKAEPVIRRESFFFPARDLYERMLLERPPRDNSAEDHIEYAKECAAMELYDKALEHLDVAEQIDPRVKKQLEEFRARVADQYADQQAEKLYNRMLLAMRGEDYNEALATADRIIRNFQSSEFRTKTDQWLPILQKRAKEDQKKRVCYMFYMYVDDFLQNKLYTKIRVDKDGRPLPPKPGKAVYCRGGRVFRGEPVSLGEDEIVLKNGDTTIKISNREVVAVRDIDLNTEGKLVYPPFSMMHSYVTDKKGGLGHDVAGAISRRLKIPEEKVWEIWDKRLATTIVYNGGIPRKTSRYSKICTACYGPGSWLREVAGSGGRGGRASSGNDLSPGDAANPPVAANQRTGSGNSTTNNNNKKAFNDPWTSDDPEIFWKVNSLESRFNILKAFAAETYFKVLSVYGRRCPTCGGLGYIRTLQGAGNESRRICPTCRGKGYFRRIQYE